MPRPLQLAQYPAHCGLGQPPPLGQLRIGHQRAGRGNLVKYKIVNWHRHNTVLDYNCPCQKETGFFFLPVSTAVELVGTRPTVALDSPHRWASSE